jgi:hypothetical protein
MHSQAVACCFYTSYGGDLCCIQGPVIVGHLKLKAVPIDIPISKNLIEGKRKKTPTDGTAANMHKLVHSIELWHVRC